MSMLPERTCSLEDRMEQRRMEKEGKALWKLQMERRLNEDMLQQQREKERQAWIKARLCMECNSNVTASQQQQKENMGNDSATCDVEDKLERIESSHIAFSQCLPCVPMCLPCVPSTKQPRNIRRGNLNMMMMASSSSSSYQHLEGSSCDSHHHEAMQQLQLHLPTECPQRFVECANGCGVPGLRHQNERSHLKYVCPRRLVPCSTCSQKVEDEMTTPPFKKQCP